MTTLVRGWGARANCMFQGIESTGIQMPGQKAPGMLSKAGTNVTRYCGEGGILEATS